MCAKRSELKRYHFAMSPEQQALVARLTESMNDCATAWIVYGPFEVTHIAKRLLHEVPHLANSRADADDFARTAGGAFRWTFVDADRGSAAFIIPRDNRSESWVGLRDQLLALEDGLRVTACIYGNVDDDVWLTLGAGRRIAIPAQDFLP